jgi:hypothetical protein
MLAVDAPGDLADRRGVLGRDEDVRHGPDRRIDTAGLRLALLACSEPVARISILGGKLGCDQRVSVGQRTDVLGQRVAQRGVQQVRGPDVEVRLAVRAAPFGSQRRR